eukprot:9158385-Alexandrium_andersonii.AAC.1
MVADAGSHRPGSGTAHPGIVRSGRVDQTDPAPPPSRRRRRSERLGAGPREQRGDSGAGRPAFSPGLSGGHFERGQSREARRRRGGRAGPRGGGPAPT